MSDGLVSLDEVHEAYARLASTIRTPDVAFDAGMQAGAKLVDARLRYHIERLEANAREWQAKYVAQVTLNDLARNRIERLTARTKNYDGPLPHTDPPAPESESDSPAATLAITETLANFSREWFLAMEAQSNRLAQTQVANRELTDRLAAEQDRQHAIVSQLLDALGKPNVARPESPEVVFAACLTAVRDLVAQVASLPSQSA